MQEGDFMEGLMLFLDARDLDLAEIALNDLHRVAGHLGFMETYIANAMRRLRTQEIASRWNT
jgi:hypothetical protein